MRKKNMGGVLSYVVFLKAQILEREKVLYFSDPVVKTAIFQKVVVVK